MHTAALGARDLMEEGGGVRGGEKSSDNSKELKKIKATGLMQL